jgi:hypothetical protein
MNIIRSPVENRLSDSGPYTKYLDNIASELKPYENYFLGLTPVGNFRYFKNEMKLITETSIKSPSLQGKVILFCNGNMSYYGATKGNNHLNHYVNARIFMNDPMGVSVSDTINAAVTDSPVVTFASGNSLSQISNNEIESWATSNKTRFNIGIAPTTAQITTENLQPLINMGINSVPVYIDTNDINKMGELGYWGINPWVFRPSTLRISDSTI